MNKILQNKLDFTLSLIEKHISNENEVSLQRNNLVVQILALLPYIANCNNPEASSLLNVNTYFLMSEENTKSFFFHTTLEDSDIFKRITPLLNLDGGNEQTIKQGKLCLALIMLQDYEADKAIDLQNNKYNPLNSKAWDYTTLHNTLISQLDLNNSFFNYFNLEYILKQDFWKSQGGKYAKKPNNI